MPSNVVRTTNFDSQKRELDKFMDDQSGLSEAARPGDC